MLSTLMLSAALAAGQQSTSTSAPEPRSVAAVRLADTETIRLDGEMTEEAWQRAVPAGGFIQIDPDNGKAATEPTEVRVLFSREALYLGVTCIDSEPDKWLGYQRRRDEFLQADDRFQWTIDTFHDAQSGYFFEMNPSGLMADSLMGGGTDNRQWDGIWNARVRHSRIGWTIEIEIPFRMMNFDPDVEAWGINFQRTVRRKNEDSIWTGWARNQGLRRMTNAGLLTGITQVSQGLGLDVKPYALLTGEASPGRGTPDLSRNGDVGVDVFYSPTPGLRTVATINTDFAQTEVDQRQVNLTRFSLFFPEKRDFFLDGAPSFSFGSPSGDLIVNPFFSRRIGLTAGGTPQAINFGGKVTGQVGRQDIGLLHVQTSNDEGLTGDNFTVARVRRRVLAQSFVGAIYTRRDLRADSATTRHTAGIDFRLATSRFLGSQNLETTGYLLYASDPAVSNGKASYGARVSLPNDRWNMDVAAREVGEHFNPAVGFVTRTGYRRYQPSLEFAPRPRTSQRIRRFSFAGSMDVQTDLHNELLTRTIEGKFLQIDFQSQDSFAISTAQARERLDEDFRISSTITLPAGGVYDYTRVNIRGSTANRRVLALNGSFETGGFYSGTRDQMSVGLTLRARPGLIVYTTTEWNGIDLPEGTFQTRLYRLIGETQFSPWIALVNNFQYDSVSRVLGWQSRFRWIVTPGSDVYFVYTHNWLDDPALNRFQTLDRRIASKLLYTHGF